MSLILGTAPAAWGSLVGRAAAHRDADRRHFHGLGCRTAGHGAAPVTEAQWRSPVAGWTRPYRAASAQNCFPMVTPHHLIGGNRQCSDMESGRPRSLSRWAS